MPSWPFRVAPSGRVGSWALPHMSTTRSWQRHARSAATRCCPVRSSFDGFLTSVLTHDGAMKVDTPTYSIDDLLEDDGLTGISWCEARADRVDEYLTALHVAADAPAGTALVALGGYGRRELCPGSDLDVALVHAPGVEIGAVADRLWYPVWDAGLKLGHQVGTVDQILEVARESLDTATSLLSTRLVAGDDFLAGALADGGRAQWSSRWRRHHRSLGTAVGERHARFGEVAFLLEPDLKEARGGLRDVHTLGWLEMNEPVLREVESAALVEAAETLLAARVELHRVTGRLSDRLLLELQDEVADRLGYQDADLLMADIAGAGRTIAWTGDGALRRISRVLRYQGRRMPPVFRRRREVAPGMFLEDGLIHLAASASFDDPLAVLRCAQAAAGHEALLGRRSLERLAAEATPLPEPWPEEARRLFVDLLATGEPAVAVIEDLDQMGLFVPILPEWEPCRSRPQRNAYHRFTVDRHLLVAAAEAALLVDRVQRPDLLLVGALLHDIGKGYPGDHTEVGQELVATIAPRMGFPAADVDHLVAMVEHHLLLPDVATRRDLDDDGTIRSVADAVGDRQLLALLGALTEADSIATGPSAWSSWKAELVEELVRRVDHVLAGGEFDEADAGRFPDAEQRELLEGEGLVVRGDGSTLTVAADDRTGSFSKIAGVLALNGAGVVWAAAHSENARALSVFRVQGAFGEALDWEHIRRQVELALEGRLAVAARLGDRSRTYRTAPTSARPAKPRVAVDNRTSVSATVLEVTCPDGVGVLYRITRAFAELDLDIVSARVQTLGSDVVDAFYVRDVSGSKIVDAEHLAEIELAVLRWIDVDF
ncbi:MAG: [protein-PII] uridylyltransferase [Acidimicrobiaceae bacterium]|nr:[protein-PII] uridylyltransferase [Acidimicrobiaceae bacterium]